MQLPRRQLKAVERGQRPLLQSGRRRLIFHPPAPATASARTPPSTTPALSPAPWVKASAQTPRAKAPAPSPSPRRRPLLRRHGHDSCSMSGGAGDGICFHAAARGRSRQTRATAAAPRPGATALVGPRRSQLQVSPRDRPHKISARSNWLAHFVSGSRTVPSWSPMVNAAARSAPRTSTVSLRLRPWSRSIRPARAINMQPVF